MRKERDSNTAHREIRSLAQPLSYLFDCDSITQTDLLLYPYETLTGLLLLHPLKKRTKNDAPGRDRVDIYREIVTGLELEARHQRTLERAGSYPNSNRRPVVSDRLLFR